MITEIEIDGIGTLRPMKRFPASPRYEDQESGQSSHCSRSFRTRLERTAIQETNA